MKIESKLVGDLAISSVRKYKTARTMGITFKVRVSVEKGGELIGEEIADYLFCGYVKADDGEHRWFHDKFEPRIDLDTHMIHLAGLEFKTTPIIKGCKVSKDLEAVELTFSMELVVENKAAASAVVLAVGEQVEIAFMPLQTEMFDANGNAAQPKGVIVRRKNPRGPKEAVVQ